MSLLTSSLTCTLYVATVLSQILGHCSLLPHPLLVVCSTTVKLLTWRPPDPSSGDASSTHKLLPRPTTPELPHLLPTFLRSPAKERTQKREKGRCRLQCNDRLFWTPDSLLPQEGSLRRSKGSELCCTLLVLFFRYTG